jgi:hypothetical protein
MQGIWQGISKIPGHLGRSERQITHPSETRAGKFPGTHQGIVSWRAGIVAADAGNRAQPKRRRPLTGRSAGDILQRGCEGALL